MKPYKHVRDKGNPLVQRFIDAMEIVGARPDKAEVSSLGNIHLSYCDSRFIIKSDGIGVVFSHGSNTNYYQGKDLIWLVNSIWERGVVDEYSRLLFVPQDYDKHLHLEIKAEYWNNAVLSQKLIVMLDHPDWFKPKKVRSTNPDHIAIARGYLLGDTPAEVVLEYLCEVCPQINEFVYPVGQ